MRFIILEDYYKYACEWSIKCLEATGYFLRKHPELINKQGGRLVPYFGLGPLHGSKICNEEWERWIKNTMNNCKKLIQTAKAHPDKKVRSYGFSLEFYRDMILNNFALVPFRNNLRNYLLLHKELPMNLQQYFMRNSFGPLRRTFFPLQRILQEENKKYKLKQKNVSALERLRVSLSSSKKSNELAKLIIKNAKNVIKLRKRCTESQVQGLFLAWASKLSRGKSKKCRQALAVLNYPVIVKRLKSQKDYKLSSNSRSRITKETERGGMIYLLVAKYIRWNNKHLSL